MAKPNYDLSTATGRDLGKIGKLVGVKRGEKSLVIDWEKRLSAAAKAEILAATFHLLSDHMPKVWKKVPAWLRGQIKQAMCDCSGEFKDFTPKQLKLCVDYCQWLNEKYPQPGSTLHKLLKQGKKPSK